MRPDAWLQILQTAVPPPARRLAALVATQGTAERVLKLSRGELLAAGLSEQHVERLKNSDEERMDRWRRWLDGPGRVLVTLDSPGYPALLKEVPGAPLALWVEGERSELLNGPQLAMVGSRSPTANGRETARGFARYLSERGLTIVSGLATGIDGASHRGALAGVGGTIAVLGCGPDVVFPRSHARLTADIAAAGLIISEYPPGTPPLGAHFPRRNRIIAGMSAGTLVVEAARRSGSLITARLAGNYGREVFAIPGSIHNPLAKGCHRLIRDGAKLVEDAADVLVELAPLLQLTLETEPAGDGEQTETVPLASDPEYGRLLAALGFDPCGISELASRTGLTAAELSSMLLLLEMEGLVEALPGGRYSRLSTRTP